MAPDTFGTTKTTFSFVIIREVDTVTTTLRFGDCWGNYSHRHRTEEEIEKLKMAALYEAVRLSRILVHPRRNHPPRSPREIVRAIPHPWLVHRYRCFSRTSRGHRHSIQPFTPTRESTP